MSSDPNKKSPRTFQCRDMLWETFEQMARELECSVDYLINEAMKQYARQRSYGGRTPYPNTARDSMQPGGAYGSAPPPMPPSLRPTGVPGRTTASGLPPPPPPRGGALPAPPPPPRSASPAAPAMGSTSRLGGGAPSTSRSQPPPAPRSAPPPIPPRGTSMPPLPSLPGSSLGSSIGASGALGGSMGSPPLGAPAGGAASGVGVGVGGLAGANGGLAHGAALNIMYQGEKIPITKDRFVIGRGKQSSDLTLKDPNVSRQHAMIEYQNGVYFMVDMGSTNGVEYNGQRIARKQIAEGDVFRICDHDLRFTYR